MMFDFVADQDIPEIEKNSGTLIEETKLKVKRMTAHCSAYNAPETRKAVGQLLNTVLPFFAVYAVMLAAYQSAYWLTLLLTPVAAGLLVRLFIIQHDCGHGSFLKGKTWNNRIGRFISVLTWTPYDFWRKTHNMHHSGSGNLDARGYGAIETLTVKEFAALTPKNKFLYRFYRNPLFLLVVGTPLFILIAQRIPLAKPFPFSETKKEVTAKQIWKSVMGLNAALLVVFGGLSLVFGVVPVLVSYVPIVVCTAWIGGWLFYIQHQFEDAHWDYGHNWDYHEAAVLGSSYYVLPPVLQWFTGNIGLHHIHHLNAKIPNYRLQECLDASEDLKTLNRITFLQSLKLTRLALWDEEQRKMVSFKNARAVV